jgi:hypothetical protein
METAIRPGSGVVTRRRVAAAVALLVALVVVVTPVQWYVATVRFRRARRRRRTRSRTVESNWASGTQPVTGSVIRCA